MQHELLQEHKIIDNKEERTVIRKSENEEKSEKREEK
jgi:hypothetical protein